MTSIQVILRAIVPSAFLRSGAPAALRLGGAFVQFLGTILIARTLGAAQAGDFFFWSAVLMTCGFVALFGLDRLAQREVPRLDHDNDPQALSHFLAPVRVTSMILSLGLAVIVAAYGLFIQTEIARPPWWFLLPPCCMAGVALCMIHGETIAGLGRPVLGIFYRHSLNTALFVLAIAIAGSRLTSNLALAFYSAAFLIAGLVPLLGLGRNGPGPALRIPSRREFRDHLALGLPIFLTSLFGALAYLWPLAILERSCTGSQMAYLITAYRLFILFDVLATAIHSPATPDLSRATQEGNRRKCWQAYLHTTKKGVLHLWAPMLFVMVFADSVMRIFGSEFGEGAASVLRVFIAIGLVSLAVGPATNLVIMTGRTKRMAAFACLRMVVTGLAALLVIPALGPTGMAFVLGGGVLMEKAYYLRCAHAALSEKGRAKL